MERSHQDELFAVSHSWKTVLIPERDSVLVFFQNTTTLQISLLSKACRNVNQPDGPGQDSSDWRSISPGAEKSTTHMFSKHETGDLLQWFHCKATLPRLSWSLSHPTKSQLTCKSNFLNIVDALPEASLPCLLTTVYLVANAKRPLKLPELIELTKLATQLALEIDITHERASVEIHGFRHLDLLKFKPGGVYFTELSMYSFINNILLPIAGRGHSLFTQICLQQLDNGNNVQSWLPFTATPSRLSDAYIHHYWMFHYKDAEKENNPSIVHQLAQIIGRSLLQNDIEAVSVLRRKEINENVLEISESYGFKALGRVLQNMGAGCSRSCHSQAHCH